ncbi:hypothetical protein GCM10020220_051350 [Nonomuraea rubra]
MYGLPDGARLQDAAAQQPDLAESWTTSEDGLTWTFKIRAASGPTAKPVTTADDAAVDVPTR